MLAAVADFHAARATASQAGAKAQTAFVVALVRLRGGGRSQAEAAALLGVSQAHVSRVLAGLQLPTRTMTTTCRDGAGSQGPEDDA